MKKPKKVHRRAAKNKTRAAWPAWPGERRSDRPAGEFPEFRTAPEESGLPNGVFIGPVRH